jgi:DnaJ-class molecular chaperone
MFLDFYKILELSYGAKDIDIKNSYRRLAKKHHPDKNPNNKDSAEIFRLITEAYDTLIDKEKKIKYDTINKYKFDKKENNVNIETIKDIDNKRMSIKPSVVIDPSGQVYVDIGSTTINPNNVKDFFM